MGYSIGHWTSFLAVALALNLAPGPDLAFILGHTLSRGRGAGLVAMLGIWAGALGHVALAAAGLSAVVATSAATFSVVKWVGAAYLVWLGLAALRGGGGPSPGGRSTSTAGLWAVFRRGVLIDLLNPKVAVFFLAFLPQFVVPGAGPVWFQLALHGVLVIAVAALVEPPLVLLAHRCARAFGATPRLAALVERALGAMLVGLGLELALTDR